MPVVQWCLGLPHQGTVAATEGGIWQLDVRHRGSSRWTWRVSHSDHQASRSGSASSAGMAIKSAEGVLEDLERRLIDGVGIAQC